ncbi:MAG: hypothetical protein QNK33_09370 [Bacteroidales bacterium]|nr:hypothetical protein [Bacteroidales bacterium]
MKKQLWPILFVCISLIFSIQTSLGQGKVKIEKLNFSESDFFDNDGNYLYEMEYDKLPWQNTYDMLNNFMNMKQLVYKHSELIDGTKKFSSSILRADVRVVEVEDLIDVDNIFYGYDRYNLPEDAALPPNDINIDHNYNALYPLSDGSFRVIGEETITTEAGSFECTVIEVISSLRGQLQKVWMINNSPGVYARVISQLKGSYEFYWVFELQEIVRK